MKYAVILVISVIGVTISSCAATARYEANKRTQIVERSTEAAIWRAYFDMECNEVSGKLLGNAIYPMDDEALMIIGVTGCGKRVSYLVMCKYTARGACIPLLNETLFKRNSKIITEECSEQSGTPTPQKSPALEIQHDAMPHTQSEGI